MRLRKPRGGWKRCAMSITRQPKGHVFVAGVGTREDPVPDVWEPNPDHLWFRRPPRQLARGDHVFSLAPGRNPPSVVVALYEVTQPEEAEHPRNAFDPERWRYNIGVRLLRAVPPPIARRVPDV